MNRAKVLAPAVAPGENSLREALAEGLALVQGSKTDLAAADECNWSIGTVRNVRNRANTASFKIVSDAAWRSGGKFLTPWLARLGLRAVPLDATCDTDAGTHCRLAKLAVKIAMALDERSEGGKIITPDEARDMLPELDEWQAHMDRVRRLAVQA